MTREDFLVAYNIGHRDGKVNAYCPNDYDDIFDIKQQPNEDEKIIRIKKGTLKVRTGKYVIYDVEWLKTHFNTTEAKIYGQPKTGHWIKHKHNGKPYFNCSECLYFAPIGYSYCPGCGAKMQEGDK